MFIGDADRGLGGDAARGGGGGVAGQRITLGTASGRVRTLFNVIQNVDLAPTAQVVAAIPEVLKDARAVLDNWQTISQDLATLNRELRTAGLPEIDLKN